MTDSSRPADRSPEAVLARLAALDARACRRLVAEIWESAGWETGVTTGGSVDVLATRRDDGAVRRQAIRLLQRPPDATLDPSELADVRTHDSEAVTDVVVTTAGLSGAARSYAADRDISLVGADDLRRFVAGEALADVISPGSREALLERHLDAAEATGRWHPPEDRDGRAPDDRGGEPAGPSDADGGSGAPAPVEKEGEQEEKEEEQKEEEDQEQEKEGQGRRESTPGPLAPVAAAFALPSRVLARIVGRPLPGTRTATRPVRWTARLLWTLVVVALVFAVLVGLLTTVLLVGDPLLDAAGLPPARFGPRPGSPVVP